MGVTALILLTQALILTLAPAVRYHAGSERYQYSHWLGVVAWLTVFGLLHWQTERKAALRDPYLLPIISLLTGIGLMMIWRLYPALGLRQTMWLVIAGCVVWLGLQFPVIITTLHRYKYIWLAFGLLLTGLTILFGSNPSGAGPTLWLNFFGINFQPSEPLKLILIIYLAGFFADQRSSKLSPFQSVVPTLMVIGMALALLISQNDLGTATIFLALYLAMLYSINGNRTLLWITPVLLMLASIVGYFFVDIVRLRLVTWLQPFSDPLGASYQIIQSMIAIAEGGLIGTGLGLGSPGLVPVAVSDFIFSAIAEETGYLGVLVITLAILFLVYRAAKIAIQASQPFHRYLAIGIAFYFGFQSILIIGGNIGLFPITGVTLQFVSYGGSSLVISFVAVLILMTISHQSQTTNTSSTSNQPQISLISSLLVGVLIIEIIVTSVLSFWVMPALVNRDENLRWAINDRFSKRGDILARGNQTIITSSGEIGGITRESFQIPLFPIIGYTNVIFGQTGVEASMFPQLRGLEGTSNWDRFVQNLLYNQPPEGLDIRLTLDLEAQQMADILQGDMPGTVILMNADSGEILAMTSHPYFDAATLEADWEILSIREDAPLINRATQGLYPVGGALLPFLLSAQLEVTEATPDPALFLTVPVETWRCAYSMDEKPDWTKVVSNGCEAFQTPLAEKLGFDPLIQLFQDLGFFTAPQLRISTAEVQVPPISTIEALLEGDSPFQISPLQMALAASALTNAGSLPAPRIVNGYQTPEGDWVTLPKLGSKSQALPENITVQLTALLEANHSPHWQMTASATTLEGDPITWFLGGTTAAWQGQPLVVVVTLEADDPAKAEEIGLGLLGQSIRLAAYP